MTAVIASRGVAAWPYLALVRPPNLVTAAADVVAGYAVAGLPGAEPLPLLIVSGVLLYAGGVTMNDVCDAVMDARSRPERPIPSGRVSRGLAALWGMALLTAGVAGAFAVGAASGTVATALAFTALLYDAVTKERRWLGPLTMGACRSLNLLLGVSVAPAALFAAAPVALVPLLYVVAITHVSAGEVEGGNRRTLALTLVLLALALGLLVGLAGRTPALLALAPFLALLLARLASPLWSAWRRPAAAHVRAVVQRGVLSIVVLDAAIAALHAGPWWGLSVLLLAVPASALAARFAVT